MEQELGSSWIDLLSDQSIPTPPSRGGVVTVTERTPVFSRHESKANRSKWRKVSRNESIQPQRSPCLLNATSKEQISDENQDGKLKESRETEQCYVEACTKLEQQAELITRLMADNTKLISQVESFWTSTANKPESVLQDKEQTIEGLMAHIHALRDEYKLLSSHVLSKSPSSRGLLEDLERLTHKNADLCNSLAATQYSRSTLEREIIVLKRTLLEQRTGSGQRSNDHILEFEALLTENEKLKLELDHLLTEKERLQSLTTSQKEQLECYENDLKQSNLQLNKLRQSQVTEIDQRCRQVDILKQQLSDQLESLQHQRDSLVSHLKVKTSTLASSIEECNKLRHEIEELRVQLERSSEHASQLQNENATLHNQLKRSQRQYQEELKEARMHIKELNEKMKDSTANMEHTLSELESTRAANIMHGQQVHELQAEVEVLKSQLHSRSQLSNELKQLLQQRTSKIESLEKTLRQQKDTLTSSLTDLYNASVDSQIDVACSLHNSVSPSPNHSISSSRYSSFQSDTLHLKQRLADSRQVTLRLEVQLAQLKTDNAKLSGSYQALLSIRNQLSEENVKIRSSNKDLLKEREDLLEKTEALSKESINLTALLHAAKDELCQVTKVCQRQEEELEGCSVQILSAQRIQADLEHTTAEASMLTSRVEILQTIVAVETKEIEAQMLSCDDSILNSRHEISDLEDNVHICETVNSTRRVQMKVCDETVATLQGELEVLQARKNILLSISEENRTTPSKKCSSLRPLDCASNASLLNKLNQKLKAQKRKSNFLRVKLGYTLSELRLYKQLKKACDCQLSELQEGLVEVQRQYQQCAAQLADAQNKLSSSHQTTSEHFHSNQ